MQKFLKSLIVLMGLGWGLKNGSAYATRISTQEMNAFWHYANALYAQQTGNLNQAIVELQAAAHDDPQANPIKTIKLFKNFCMHYSSLTVLDLLDRLIRFS